MQLLTGKQQALRLTPSSRAQPQPVPAAASRINRRTASSALRVVAQALPSDNFPSTGSPASSKVATNAQATMDAPTRTAVEAATSNGQIGPVRTGLTSEPDYIRLNNGALLPILGYGTFMLTDPNVVKMALEVGYRHLDCAAYYKNEKVVGQGIRDWLAADSNNKREDLFVTSKIFNDSHRPEQVRASAEKTIADLGVGYLDMMLIHWPDAFKPGMDNDFYGPVCEINAHDTTRDAKDVVKEAAESQEDGKQSGCVTFDEEVTMEDTWQAMEKLVDDGLVRCIGLSNFSHKEVKEVCDMSRIKPVVNQVELHPMLGQKKLVDRCFNMGVQCLAYGPLGGPNAYVPNDLLPHPVVSRVAQECGKSNGQVLVRWSMQRGVPVLVKTGTLGRLKENLWGMMDWRMTDEQMASLNALEAKKRFVDVPWKTWDTSLDDPVSASGTMSSAA
uniref:NADP-dependent oxidoreductase domain-containing protein n=1 Tax=Dunaliella tertiolecta TaxID=3047 RepID=A0A7S3QQH8_DUNTE